MRVEGEIQVGEASRAAMTVQQRLFGTPRLAYAGLLFGVAAVTWFAMAKVAPWIEETTHSNIVWLALPVALLVGWVFFARRLMMSMIKGHNMRGLAARGVSGAMPIAIEIDETGVTSTTGLVTRRAPWPAVTDLFPAGAYWVIVVQGEPWYLAKRFFADVEAERAFVTEAFGRLTAAAQGRSQEAGRMAQELV